MGGPARGGGGLAGFAGVARTVSDGLGEVYGPDLPGGWEMRDAGGQCVHRERASPAERMRSWRTLAAQIEAMEAAGELAAGVEAARARQVVRGLRGMANAIDPGAREAARQRAGRDRRDRDRRGELARGED